MVMLVGRQAQGGPGPWLTREDQSQFANRFHGGRGRGARWAALFAGSLLLAALSPTSRAATEFAATAEILHEFTGSNGDGKEPRGPLTEGPDGFLYGTTLLGGHNSKGTIYRIRNDGSTYRVLHEFTGLAGDGAEPVSGVILARDGKLYGTTSLSAGGVPATIFRLAVDGKDYQVLKRFDPASPTANLDPVLRELVAGLFEGSDGLLYGGAYRGGASGYGALFAIAKDGSGYRRLHDFAGFGADGTGPRATLIEARDGLLYGTTAGGGRANRGTVFRMGRNGQPFEVICHLGNTPDEAAWPCGALLENEDGFLYGTARLGGGSLNQGAVFRLAPSGNQYRVLQTFNNVFGPAAGRPGEGLVRFEGQWLITTMQAGANANATGFVVLDQNAQSCHIVVPTGVTPPFGSMVATAAPIRAKDGFYYGATSTEGRFNAGRLYRLKLERRTP